MNKRIAVMLIAVSMLIIFAGCAKKTQTTDSPWNTSLPFGTKRPLPSGFALATIGPKTTGLDISGELKKSAILYWDAFKYGGDASIQDLSYKVYTDHASFNADLGERAAEFGERYDQKSFGEAFVIAVYCVVPTGGYSFEASSANIEDGVMKIKIIKNSPAAGTVVTQAFEVHCVLLAIDSTIYSEDLTYEIEYAKKGFTLN